MPRPRTLKPKYCFDKPSGRAFVILDGAKKYLGRYGTQESRDNYDRVIGEWIGKGRPRCVPARAADGVTVNQVIAAFWSHAKRAYPAPPYQEGKRPRGELGNFWDALRPLRRLYGATAADSFGPRALMAVRDAMTQPRQIKNPVTGEVVDEPGWCRHVANRHLSRLKHVFKCAVEHELIPGEVYYRLSTVKGYRRPRSDVRETEEIKPVPQAYIDAVLPHVSAQVRAMIRLQLLTGMRPGEVCGMRTCEIETSGRVWVYRPRTHKTAYHGHKREIRLGPRARAIVEPFLRADVQAHILSPADAETERRAAGRQSRTTPRRPWEHRCERSRAAKRERQRAPRDRYDVPSYRRAIARACERADRLARKQDPTAPPDRVIIPTWHPNQLRHNAATFLEREYGIDVARAVLGHRSVKVTERYVAMDFAKSEQAMAEVG
jgi:integrase